MVGDDGDSTNRVLVFLSEAEKPVVDQTLPFRCVVGVVEDGGQLEDLLRIEDWGDFAAKSSTGLCERGMIGFGGELARSVRFHVDVSWPDKLNGAVLEDREFVDAVAKLCWECHEARLLLAVLGWRCNIFSLREVISSSFGA